MVEIQLNKQNAHIAILRHAQQNVRHGKLVQVRLQAILDVRVRPPDVLQHFWRQ